MTDYLKRLGLEQLAARASHGRGVRVAVLDSGTPPDAVMGSKYAASSRERPDVNGHATAVASILAGGGRDIVGICRNADFVYIPVLGDDGSGSAKSVADGILDAVEADVDLINLSVGFARTEKCPKKLEKACKIAFYAGKTVICAAGNDGNAVNWPAGLHTTIGIGSSAKNGLKTSFSSVGEVDFVAPGVDLEVLTLSGGVKTVSGTSFSTAIATGVAALLVACMKGRRNHSVGMEAVRNALRAVAKDVDEPGWDARTGYGVLADPTVNMRSTGFFDRIICKITGLFGSRERNRC